MTTVVERWTGRHASALRRALRLTNEAFAERLGTAVRTVAKWNAQPELVPVPDMQQALDTLLRQADDDARDRFVALTQGQQRSPEDDWDRLQPFIEWVDQHAGWAPGTAARRLTAGPRNGARPMDTRAGRRPRAGAAAALIQLYGAKHTAATPYACRIGESALTTSIITKAEWTACPIPLGRGKDQLTPTPRRATAPDFDDQLARAAVARIGEMAARQTRAFDAPIYCLDSITIDDQQLDGTLSLAQFADYALTMDLLESELLAAMTRGPAPGWDDLPLRARLLPSLDSVLNMDQRLCAGGVLSLLAIARPASLSGRPPDYALAIQERSTAVVNATRRLAVIPKAFHQPLAGYSDDAQLLATLLREFEEELLGRAELEQVAGSDDGAHLDPQHRTLMTAPMRALADQPDAWSAECTGFGINLTSGNYEFASLLAINDDRWWQTYGGQLVTNWEAAGIRHYSSLDPGGITALAHEAGWSDEGLFAFIQGMRRLSEIGDERVNLPTIELGTPRD